MTRVVGNGNAQREIPYIIAGAGGYDANALQEANKADFKLQDTSDPEFRLHRFLAQYGYLRVAVKKAKGQKPATLRVEFHTPTTPGTAVDACELDLEKHRLL